MGYSFSELHERPNRPYQGSLLAGDVKSISDINIHLAGRFQPIGHLLASTKAI